MRPVVTDATNFTFELPGGTAANDLPCRREGANVYSSWQADEEDLRDLSADYPRVVLDVHWPAPVIAIIRVGGADPDDEKFETERLLGGRDSYWRFTRVLSDREVQCLRDGALIEIMVGMNPPPPVSLQLD